MYLSAKTVPPFGSLPSIARRPQTFHQSRLTRPFTALAPAFHTQPVCKLPLTTPKPTRAAQLSTNTTLKEAQNCPMVYSTLWKGTLKYAMTRLAGRKRMVNLVRRRVMRVRCSTSTEAFCSRQISSTRQADKARGRPWPSLAAVSPSRA